VNDGDGGGDICGVGDGTVGVRGDIRGWARGLGAGQLGAGRGGGQGEKEEERGEVDGVLQCGDSDSAVTDGMENGHVERR